MKRKSVKSFIGLSMAFLMMVSSLEMSVFASEINDNFTDGGSKETIISETTDDGIEIIEADDKLDKDKLIVDESFKDDETDKKSEESKDSKKTKKNTNKDVVSDVNKAFNKSVTDEDVKSWEDDLQGGGTGYEYNTQESSNDSYYRADNTDTTFDGAAQCVRKNAINRNRFFTVKYTQSGEYEDAPNTLPFDLLEKAFEENKSEKSNFKDGDYLRAHYIGASAYTTCILPDEDDNYTYIIKYNLQMTTSADQEAVVDKKIKEIITSLKLNNKTDYEKIVAIYDYVADSVRYNREAADKGAGYANGKYLAAWSAYGALCQHTCVCQGYAGALNRLLNEAGIENCYITGYAGEEHAWNLVKLNGVYYNLDATWDADGDSLLNHKSGHEWFLMSDNDFVAHERDEIYDSRAFRKSHKMSKKSYLYESKWQPVEASNVDFVLHDISGNDISTTSDGKVKVMVFGDCENVRSKMLLRSINKEKMLANPLVDVLYLDNKYTKESIEAFLEENGCNIITGCYNGEDGYDTITPVLEEYVKSVNGEEKYSVPYVVIVDGDNIVRLATYERISARDISKEVYKYLPDEEDESDEASATENTVEEIYDYKDTTDYNPFEYEDIDEYNSGTFPAEFVMDESSHDEFLLKTTILSKKVEYVGKKPKTPKIKVEYIGGRKPVKLKKGRDYTVKNLYNKDSGKASIEVTGIGKYEGYSAETIQLSIN